MRRPRRPSFGSGDGSGTPGGFDQKRRTELLAEARRKRVAWVEEARGVDEGVDGARKRKEDEAAENGRKAESELERLFPSAVKFHDFLSGLAGDPEESPMGDLSAILQPFMLQDVDIRDDRPIPSYREGSRPYDVFLDKLRHPRAAEVVKGLQQFVAAFKARSERRKVGVMALSSPGPRGISGSSSSLGSGQAPGSTSPRVGGRNWGVELLPAPGAAGGVRKSSSAGGESGTAATAGAGAATTVTAATMSGMMHAFLGRLETQMRENVLWRRETEAQWEETRESIERIVMHKVFSEAYGLAEAPQRDEAISERLRSLGFLREEHLGVPPLVDSKVRALLEKVEVTGKVLDICGAKGDAVAMVMTEQGLRVTTNDLNRCLQADTHYDASSEACFKAFTDESSLVDWIVTSPPYKNAFEILSIAWRIARVGVAFKLRLTFLEPTKARGNWFKENPPSAVVALPRATYRGRPCNAPEAWFVWRRSCADGTPSVQAVFFAV